MNCPLCAAGAAAEITHVNKRPFFRCPVCTLVFIPPQGHCTVGEELARYALHDNTDVNAGYVRYLGQTVSVVCDRRPSGGTVLDYGCGEHAVLSGLLGERGMACRSWDPLYEHRRDTLTDGERFDVIVLNEVIEHCRNIKETLERVRALLADEGIVVIRTQCIPDDLALFGKWWYVQDPTHVIFFSRGALTHAAALLDRTLETTGYPDIFIMS